MGSWRSFALALNGDRPAIPCRASASANGRRCEPADFDARNREAATVLVQETFIKVWLRCATFRGQSELLPWIRAILRNGLLDRVRRAHPEVPFDADDELTEEAGRRVAELSAQYVPTPDDAMLILPGLALA